MRKQQHVVKTEDGWGVKGTGNSKYTVLTDTQKEAIEIARGIAKNQGAELIVHGRDGKIRESDSFGNDPCPPKDANN